MTRAFFAQRNFDTAILSDFYEALGDTLVSKTDEGSIYMGKLIWNLLTAGTSLRELVHTFRHRTLVLLKMLFLHKKASPYRHG